MHLLITLIKKNMLKYFLKNVKLFMSLLKLWLCCFLHAVFLLNNNLDISYQSHRIGQWLILLMLYSRCVLT